MNDFWSTLKKAAIVLGVFSPLVAGIVGYATTRSTFAAAIDQHEKRLGTLEAGFSQIVKERQIDREALTEIKTDVKWIRAALDKAGN